jgi:chromosome segregation protein
VEEFTGLRDQARLEIAGTEEKVRAGEEQLAHLNSQVENFTKLRGETQLRFDAAQDTLQMLAAHIGTVEAERAEVEEEKIEQQRLAQRQEQELAALELQQRNFQLRIEALQFEHTSLAQRRETAESAISRQAEQISAAETLLEDCRTTWQEAQQIRRESEDKLRESERARTEIGKAHQQLLARRDALAQLEEQHASAPQATQRLLKDNVAETAGDLNGTLSEHISVQAGYEAPLALLLGDAVNALILNNDASAQVWRAKLAVKEQCAFVPLHAARPTPLPSSADTHATRFLTVKTIVKNLVAALLEDAHVVENLKAAWTLKAAQPQSTIATRTGELITRSGLLLVGQEAGASLTVLTRQSDLRRLEVEISDWNGKLSQAQGVVDELHSALEEKTGAVERSRAALQEAEIALAAQRQEERGARSDAAQVTRQMEDSAREMARLTAQEQVDHERRERLHDSMAAAETTRTEAEGRIAELKDQLERLADEETVQTTALTELKIELATQIQQCEAWQQQREPVASRLQELRELIRLRTRESAEHAERVTQSEAEILAAKQEQVEKEEDRQRVAGDVTQAQTRRAEVQTQIDAEEGTLRGLRREHGEMQTARAENEVKLAEQKLFLGNLRERFQRDYQKELEDLPALEEAEAITDWSVLESDITSKRSALDAIGPVNLEAITEYDELEQRHKFLADQETDLLSAKEQILKAIQEINRTTQKLFAETFEQVKANFQEMFTELFGGGKATLSLMDESDPLECGIDIVARPPGKQNQNVTLLSGGERTMTAVALLFAIYMVKPSPFCVLDELDAPLDESNINRFIKILQRFVQQSQFIVITHNKRTISVADVLYGVTMEERGVSRVVSMRLQKNEAYRGVRERPTESTETVPSLAESVTV